MPNYEEIAKKHGGAKYEETAAKYGGTKVTATPTKEKPKTMFQAPGSIKRSKALSENRKQLADYTTAMIKMAREEQDPDRVNKLNKIIADNFKVMGNVLEKERAVAEEEAAIPAQIGVGVAKRTAEIVRGAPVGAEKAIRAAMPKQVEGFFGFPEETTTAEQLLPRELTTPETTGEQIGKVATDLSVLFAPTPGITGLSLPPSLVGSSKALGVLGEFFKVGTRGATEFALKKGILEDFDPKEMGKGAIWGAIGEMVALGIVKGIGAIKKGIGKLAPAKELFGEKLNIQTMKHTISDIAGTAKIRGSTKLADKISKIKIPDEGMNIVEFKDYIKSFLSKDEIVQAMPYINSRFIEIERRMFQTKPAVVAKPIPGKPKYVPKPLDNMKGVPLDKKSIGKGWNSSSLMEKLKIKSTAVKDVFKETTEKLPKAASKLDDAIAKAPESVDINPLIKDLEAYAKAQRKIKMTAKADFAQSLANQIGWTEESIKTGGKMSTREAVQYKQLFDKAKFVDPAMAYAKDVYYVAGNSMRGILHEYKGIAAADETLTELLALRNASQKAIPKVDALLSKHAEAVEKAAVDAIRKNAVQVQKYEQAVEMASKKAFQADIAAAKKYETKVRLGLEKAAREKFALPTSITNPRQMLEYINRVFIPTIKKAPRSVLSPILIELEKLISERKR